MTRTLLSFACFIFISIATSAQVSILWQTRYTSAGSNADRAEDLVIDSKGNIYVTGVGRGVSGNFDYITIKYDSTGVQQWKMEYNGPGNLTDAAHEILVDTGFVYVTGWSYGGVATGYDYATVKYNKHTGALVWATRYTGTLSAGVDEAFDIALDNLANVYITGTSESSFINKANSAAATIKYNAAGVQQWAARFEGAGGGLDAAYALVVEPVTGTVYVAGSTDTASFPSTNINYAALKYNTAGALQWSRTYNGPALKLDDASDIALDALGNIYVTGYSQNAVVTNSDIATLKYNSAGVRQWVQRYNGTGNDFDKGNAIKVDAVGNVYVTGRSVGVSPAAEDIITLKYNTGGTQKWVARYNNGSSVGPYDEGKALTVDAYGNVYVTGYSYMGTNKNNYTTLKYDSVGVRKWVTHYNGTQSDNDQAAAIAVDNGGNVFITGLSRGTGSNEDVQTIKYCQLTALAGLDTAICIGESVQLIASAIGAISYSWTPNNGTLSATNISNPIATPTTATTYIVTITNASGCVDEDTVVINVSQFPTTVITPSGPTSICVGDSLTLTAASTHTYQWSSSVNDTLQSITVNATGTYTVSLTNATGCTSTGTITVTVNVPNINAGLNDTICLNSSINLLATGGTTYLWHPGITLNDSTIAGPLASPTVTTTYTVLATDANGCSDSDSVTITVFGLPTIPLIASGGSYTLACVGAYTTYQWYLNNVLIPAATNQTHIYNQNGNYTVVVTDSTGCGVSSAISVVSDYIGIDEIGNVALLNVFPNPANSILFIDLEMLKASEVQIIFSSTTGQEIFRENTKQQIGNYKKHIDIQEQPSGIYYLQLLIDDKIVTKKIVKQ